MRLKQIFANEVKTSALPDLAGLLPGDGLLLPDLQLLHVGPHHPQLLLDVLDLLLRALVVVVVVIVVVVL